MAQTLILPPALRPGDQIGVMAPSSRVDRQALEEAKQFLEKEGFRVHIHPQTYAEHGQFAGTPQERAAALHDLFRNPEIRAVMCARGGNGAGQMLGHLDYELIAGYPKIVIGFSDVTALLNAIHKETGLVTFHGPVLHRLGKTSTGSQFRQCIDLLAGGNPVPLSEGSILSEGNASGPLVGGNLSLLCSLMGTPWQPDTDGAILFLEDCDDELTRFDRYLMQLKNAGVLDNISGLVLGGFTDTKDTGSLPFGFTLEERIAEYMEGRNIPIVTESPFGHGGNLYTFPIGATASLIAGQNIELRIEGPAVKGNDTGRAPSHMPYHSC